MGQARRGLRPPDAEIAYLDNVFIDISKTLEAVTGQARRVGRRRINEAARRQAPRPRCAGADAPASPGRVAAFMNSRVGSRNRAPRPGQMMRT